MFCCSFMGGIDAFLKGRRGHVVRLMGEGLGGWNLLLNHGKKAGMEWSFELGRV